MDFDNYLNRLQADLDSRLKEMNGHLETPSCGYIFCPECGTKVEESSNFCPECGQRLAEETEECYSTERAQNAGDEMILFTDTSVLAEKYDIDQEEVIELLEQFMESYDNMGVTCHLLDVADYSVGEGTWMDYSDLLQRYIADQGIAPGPKLSLFIIGGNDVIPQPCEDNPAFSPSPWGSDEYQDRVYADFYYCFYGQLQLDFLDYNRARCHVARLPLEMGAMESSIEDDLVAYFDSTIETAEDGGISIGRAVMTSNVDWIPASREMSRNLPTPCLDNEKNVVLDNMYISPSILEDMDDDLREKYYESIGEADMLVFNLHGACQPNMSGFYSSDLAFSIDMLEETNARIFNTVACWGGRYINYKREQSMLLNALYGGDVLLYSGACVPALGKCGNYQNDDTWRIQPAAYSETFMARFAEYLCIGSMTAGEAFLKAKCDYYNSSRMIEEDEYTLATVLMFNLYGCPTLHTRPDIDALSEIQPDDGSKMYRVPFRRTRREVVKKNGVYTAACGGSVLAQVRAAVDSNLERLHEGIVKHLYNELGVEPRELFSVERYQTTDTDGNTLKGYLYNYARERGHVRTQIRVKMDEQGNLLDAIQTK